MESKNTLIGNYFYHRMKKIYTRVRTSMNIEGMARSFHHLKIRFNEYFKIIVH